MLLRIQTLPTKFEKYDLAVDGTHRHMPRVPARHAVCGDGPHCAHALTTVSVCAHSFMQATRATRTAIVPQVKDAKDCVATCSVV